MGQNESLPDVDTSSDVLTITNQNLKKIPYSVPNGNVFKGLNLSGNHIIILPKYLNNLISISLSENQYQKVPKKVLEYMITLGKLQFLDLSKNYLSEIPKQMKKMVKMQKISFQCNKIQSIDNLPPNVDGFDMSQNRIINIPCALPQSLTVISLDYNLIECIESINCPNLKKVYLNMNKISHINPDISLHNLTTIELSKNNLSDLPDFNKFAPKLEKLNASVNQLTDFPKLPSKTMKEIFLAKNKISEIPQNIIEFENLTTFDMKKNLLTSLPVLPERLAHFFAPLNQITNIPDMDLPHLLRFHVMKNKIENFPQIRKANKLKEISLLRNKIKIIPTIMDFISKSLVKITLVENDISDLPKNIFRLPELTHLYLYKNNISKFPKKIRKSSITLLSFSENPIKKFPQNLPRSLHILHCSFCGIETLPDSFSSDLPDLKNLIASGNKLLNVPSFMNLEKLYLANNSFEVFPPNLPQSLCILDLSMNMIKEIPENLNLPNLYDFSISFNSLTSLPSSLSLPSIKYLRVDHNPLLSGEIDFLENSNFHEINSIDIVCTLLTLKNVNACPNLYEIMTSEAPIANSSMYKIIPKSNTFVGYSEMCGPRPSMEDAIVICPGIQAIINDNGNYTNNQKMDLFAVFDGHKGRGTSNFCAHDIANRMKNDKNATFSEAYVSKTINSIASTVRSLKLSDGSTLAMALLCGKSSSQNLADQSEEIERKVIIAHIGDSRVLIVKKTGEVKHVTSDHKPENPDEWRRILELGGKVANGRAGGLLAMSRSIGDFDVTGVVAEPTITTVSIDNEDRWIIIACDGVFDVMTNIEVGKVSTKAQNPAELAFILRDIALSRHTFDNISVIAVDLSKNYSDV